MSARGRGADIASAGIESHFESIAQQNSERMRGPRQKCSHPGSNRGPCACEAHVITNYTMRASRHSLGRNCSTRPVRSCTRRRRDRGHGGWQMARTPRTTRLLGRRTSAPFIADPQRGAGVCRLAGPRGAPALGGHAGATCKNGASARRVPAVHATQLLRDEATPIAPDHEGEGRWPLRRCK